jgi:REP-associated tyrosine transposase
MARPLRVEYAGAIYHVMSRGNLRRPIFEDDGDYRRLVEGLEQTVGRFGWELLSFVLMPNHLQLFVRTPMPNLSRGMQYLISGYANWHAKRHRSPGHLTQGRFKSALVEDESYFWTVSRYVHLNPVRGKRPLVAHPADWAWSSYPGFARRRDRVDWVAYQAIFAAWQGEMGGGNPEAAYRRFVEDGLSTLTEDPFRQATGGWLLGSPKFVDLVRSRIKLPSHPDAVPAARRLGSYDYRAVLAAVAEHFGVAPERLLEQRSGEMSRDLAAWLARELTPVTLRELSTALGLTHPDSVRNLIRRADRALTGSRSLRNQIDAIRRSLAKTENRT